MDVEEARKILTDECWSQLDYRTKIATSVILGRLDEIEKAYLEMTSCHKVTSNKIIL